MANATGQIAGLVLAGGESRRMGGGHKFLLRLGGEAIIDRVIARLSPEVAAMAISANCDASLLEHTGLPVLADPPPSRGPLSGVLAGLAWARAAGFSHLATAAADTPFFPEGMVARLREAAPSPDAVVIAASSGQMHPVFGLWPVSAAPSLDQFLRRDGGTRMMDFVTQGPWRSVDFSVERGPDPFFNINTRDDLAAAELLLEGGE